MDAIVSRKIAEPAAGYGDVKPDAAESEQLGTDVGSRLVGANRYAFSILNGLRDVLWDEMTFANKEFVERIAVETTLFNELIAKLAEAHSVRDYGAAYRECAQHQLEFVRRDMERVLKHGERAVDNAARLAQILVSNAAPNPPADVREQA
ncbi:hypothetical protein JQ604_09245 [Bradyrhizobium jicamae]|uniref:hypothetical protein n=1 Tax=Bradyrhizobium jicamae TaxID=280332 RepID=UPI001BABDBE1|nr:hypothetical protein [Bradyrhizobium jicamae]MBR0752368.1 hypothetical protein [Bradyrhizobium jicamae]